MDFRFGEAEEAFRGELLDFLDRELPDEWDALAQTSPLLGPELPLHEGDVLQSSPERAGSPWPGPRSTADRTAPTWSSSSTARR